LSKLACNNSRASLDAVRPFAGENYQAAVLHPKVHALLSRYDAMSEHDEVGIPPEEGRLG
jgi:hypothetical protein